MSFSLLSRSLEGLFQAYKLSPAAQRQMSPPGEETVGQKLGFVDRIKNRDISFYIVTYLETGMKKFKQVWMR